MSHVHGYSASRNRSLIFPPSGSMEKDGKADTAGGVEAFWSADRPLPARVRLLQWCPVVDLLALACVDESLVLYRYMKWQRVWSVHVDRIVTSLTWKPDDGAHLFSS